MPDFERLTDSLRVELAGGENEKAYARGFIAGKYFARKQFALCFVFGALISVPIAGGLLW